MPTYGFNGFTYSDELFMDAVALGCTPVRGEGASVWWRCMCPGNVHGTTQVHPIITAGSIDRAKTWA